MNPPRGAGVRRLDGLLHRAREAAFLLDATGRIGFVNRAWEELTGRPAAAVLGLECRPSGPTAASDLDDLAASFGPPPEAMAGLPAGGPTLIVRPDGERIWRRVEFWPWHDAQGALLGLFGLVRDADAPPHAPEAQGQRLRAELLEVRDSQRRHLGIDHLIGRGAGHRRLLEQLDAASRTEVPVLLVGEPGTGKRLIARTIHRRGARSGGPLIALDCSALPSNVLERELFGPDVGPPTPTSPRLALPEGSSLLLTEVLELPRDVQGRLVAALDGRVRVLATTAGDPERARRDDRLRDDLYYALTCLVIRTAPLRERPEELPLLAQHFLEQANRRGGRSRGGFSTEALVVLASYDWPGNLRELARVVDAAHSRGDGNAIAAADLPAAIRGHLASAFTPPPMPPPITPLDELLTRLERRLIEDALQHARQNKSRAAELLDISRPRLYRRIKELNIPDVPEPDSSNPPASPGS